MSVATELKNYSLCEIRQVEYDEKDALHASGAIYSAKVIRINEDDTIDFSIPEYLGEKVELYRNTRYSFLFLRDQSMKTAHGVFVQRIREDNVPMAKIKLVSSINKIQRRDYYRVGCRIDVRFQIIRLPASTFQQANYMDQVYERVDVDSWKEGVIVDISGGGMRFISEFGIMDLPYIVGKFGININGKIKDIVICGKILSRTPIPRSLFCTYRVKFVPEHSTAQNDILAFVTSQQIGVLKKE